MADRAHSSGRGAPADISANHVFGTLQAIYSLRNLPPGSPSRFELLRDIPNEQELALFESIHMEAMLTNVYPRRRGACDLPASRTTYYYKTHWITPLSLL